MPYIIETRKPYPYKAANAVPSDATIDTRTAVATLEEARETVYTEVKRFPITSTAYPFRSIAQSLPESGGTIGPLPDGTVIEVRQISHNELSADVGYPHPYFKSTADLVAAFNA